MNVLRKSLIQELIHYEFELFHNARETATRWFKKFHSRCKNLDDQAKSGWPKTMNSEAVLQAIEANSVCSIQRVSSEIGISHTHSAYIYIYIYTKRERERNNQYLIHKMVLRVFHDYFDIHWHTRAYAHTHNYIYIYIYIYINVGSEYTLHSKNETKCLFLLFPGI